jgi:hypothetical protein
MRLHHSSTEVGIFTRVVCPVVAMAADARAASKEALLPIDIHYDKFVGAAPAPHHSRAHRGVPLTHHRTDWLVSRNKASLQWPRELAPVRESVARALGELPLDIKTKYEGVSKWAPFASLLASASLQQCARV